MLEIRLIQDIASMSILITVLPVNFPLSCYPVLNISPYWATFLVYWAKFAHPVIQLKTVIMCRERTLWAIGNFCLLNVFHAANAVYLGKHSLPVY